MQVDDCTVLVPVKDFRQAKVRLAARLDPAARATLAREMASTVVAAASPLPVAVVCDDGAVSDWAQSVGAEVIWTPGLGLNGAVQAAVATLAERGVGRAIIAHSDLPLATSLAWVGQSTGITLVPDRRLDGTNVASVPTDVDFRFSYGAGSFRAHRAEASRLDQMLRIVCDERLAWDVDLPGDLALPAHL